MVNAALTPEKENPPSVWIPKFLEKLAESGNVTRACKAAKVSRVTAYKYRKEDKDFLDAWDEALGIAVGLLEDEAWRRAEEGWLEPVFFKGEQQGSVRKYSDTLLIFLLKAHKPDKYRETVRNEHTGKDGKPIQMAVTGLENLNDDDLTRLIES